MWNAIRIFFFIFINIFLCNYAIQIIKRKTFYQYFGFQMSRTIFIIMQLLEAKLDFGLLVMLELILQLPCPSITLHWTEKALLNGEITKLRRLMTVSDGNSWLKTIIRRGHILVNMVMSRVPAYPKFMKQWIRSMKKESSKVDWFQFSWPVGKFIIVINQQCG